MRNERPLSQSIKDACTLPLRMLCPDVLAERLGLTSLSQERIRAVAPHIRGRLLDIGAGSNRLVAQYGNGVGVDVHEWGADTLVVEDTSNLPFQDGEFDTVSLLASLNHIPYRCDVLQEANRVLSRDGTVIITMISPFIGFFCHKIRWFSEDTKRDWDPRERYGLSKREIVHLCDGAGFSLVRHERFLAFMNNVYVFRKRNGRAEPRGT